MNGLTPTAFYSGRGNAYAMLSQYNAAIADFQKCKELKGDILNADFNLAQVYDMMGQKEEALKYYQEVAKRSDLLDHISAAKVQARLKGDWDSYRGI